MASSRKLATAGVSLPSLSLRALRAPSGVRRGPNLRVEQSSWGRSEKTAGLAECSFWVPRCVCPKRKRERADQLKFSANLPSSWRALSIRGRSCNCDRRRSRCANAACAPRHRRCFPGQAGSRCPQLCEAFVCLSVVAKCMVQVGCHIEARPE